MTGRLRSEGEAQSGLWSKIGGAAQAAALAIGAVAVAGVAIGASAVTAAANFDQQLMLVRTQAHDTTDSLDWLRQQVLALAPAVGIGPDQLVQGLYHITSVGYTGAQAIQILKVAAEGAKVGMANLDDTAYALTSTMNTFGLKGDQAQQTMATLNAIVGAGDMRFQDLNAAISTGFLAAGDTFGVSLQSMGAALAYLTDRGASADESATRLKMSITLLGAPSKQAAGIMKDLGLTQSEVAQRTSAMEQALAKSGVTTTQLSNDLRAPDGIQVALSDLVAHMQKAGLSADETAAVLSRAFGGGKSGAAIMSMVQHLDILKTKFDTVNAGQARFGQDFSDTMTTLNARESQVQAGFDSWRIALGEQLMPVAIAVLGWFASQMPSIESAVSGVVTTIGSIIGKTVAGSQGAGVAGGATGFLMALGMDSGTASTVGAVIAEIVQNVQSAATQIIPALRSIGTELVPAFQAAGPILLGAALVLSSTLAPALKLIADHANVLVPLVTALGTGFAALKTIELASTIAIWAGNFMDVATNIGTTTAVMSTLGVSRGMQDAVGWAGNFGKAALDAAGNFVSMTASAIAEGVKTSAAWIASASTSAAGWAGTKLLAAASFASTTASSVAEAVKTSAAWLAAQARIAAGWVATQAKAAASYVATVAEANPNSNAAVIMWVAGQTKIAAGWVATQVKAGASFVATAASAAANAARTAAAWVAAQAQAIGSFVATSASAVSEAAASAGAWVAAQATVVAGWVAAKVETIASFVATAAASVAQTGIMVARFALAQGAMLAIRGATLLWMAAQWLLNFALSDNPIGLVVIAVAALVAGVIWAYQNVGWFHDAVNAAWDGIKRFGEWLANTLKPILNDIGGFIGNVAGALHNLSSAASNIPVLGGVGQAMGLPAFAAGGIVTRPTLALIGEAGPEMVVPLSGINQGGQATSLAPAMTGQGSSGATIELHTHIQMGSQTLAEFVQRIQDARLTRVLTAT